MAGRVVGVVLLGVLAVVAVGKMTEIEGRPPTTQEFVDPFPE